MKKGKPDNRIIETQMPSELRFWSRLFGVSQQGLIRAVVIAGHRAQDVKDHLEALKAHGPVEDPAEVGKNAQSSSIRAFLR